MFVKLSIVPPDAVNVPLFVSMSVTFVLDNFAFEVLVNIPIVSPSESKLLLFVTEAIVDKFVSNTPAFSTASNPVPFLAVSVPLAPTVVFPSTVVPYKLTAPPVTSKAPVIVASVKLAVPPIFVKSVSEPPPIASHPQSFKTCCITVFVAVKSPVYDKFVSPEISTSVKFARLKP